MVRKKDVVVSSTDDSGNVVERATILQKPITQKYLKQATSIEIEGSSIPYYKLGIIQFAYMLQWLTEGFLSTRYGSEEINTWNFDEKLLRVAELIAELKKYSEEENARFWGTAMATKGAIDYLYPVLKQCFPYTDIYKLTDDGLNACLGKVLEDFFTRLTESIKPN